MFVHVIWRPADGTVHEAVCAFVVDFALGVIRFNSCSGRWRRCSKCAGSGAGAQHFTYEPDELKEWRILSRIRLRVKILLEKTQNDLLLYLRIKSVKILIESMLSMRQYEYLRRNAEFL